MEIIKLNLIPSGVNPTCHAKQYDKGRIIRFELFNGLTPYTLQSGDTVTLNLRKPDNTIIETSVTATQGNKYVDLVTTEQMTACFGYTLGCLKIANGEDDIGTLNFIMQIERDVLADGIPSQSVIEDLDALVAEAVGDNYYTKSQVDNIIEEAIDGVLPTDNTGKVAVANFSTSYAKPLIALKAYFEATQSGSGDPAPDNARSISGVNNITLTVNGSNVSIALENTYYGGFLNVISGELTITWIKKLLSDLSWDINTTEYAYKYFVNPSNISDRALNKNYFCEIFTSSGALRSQLTDNDIGAYNNTTGLRRFCIRCDSASDLTEFNNIIANHYICYELLAPYTVLLTPEQIQTIIGTNNISSDSGDVDVSYKCSVEEYVNNHISNTNRNLSMARTSIPAEIPTIDERAEEESEESTETQDPEDR